MKKIICLLMSLSLVAFASCSDDDRDTPSNASSTQTENGGSGDNSGNNGGGNSGSQSAVTVFKSGTENGHDYVDLGLTSGTKWATCNVGASNPEEFGNYYAWGETTTKEIYSWSTYKYGSDFELTKYCSASLYGKDGFTDSKATLDPSDDAAYVNWGGKWRMPTYEQLGELRNECYWVWTESYNNSNVKGYIVYKAKASSYKGVTEYSSGSLSSSYSLSDVHIFLPAAGYRGDGVLDVAELNGHYWSSSLTVSSPAGVVDQPNDAWYIFFFESSYVGRSNGNRYFGLSVRAVIPGE
ncbi:MAG: hypothetical protein J6K01_05795 [Paludibacteraceae bacterium]|nr:hypothetical protein [Paludibacteraceae bacterium]